MRNFIVGILIALLVGCTAVNPKITLPDATTFMTTPCVETLQGIDNGATKTDVLSATANNSKEYYTCAKKVDDWNLFYNGLKKAIN